MRRGVVIAVSVMGVILVILMVALAIVGTERDTLKIDRDDLQFELDGLQREVLDLSEERRTLQAQLAEQLKAIEQSKTELERLRANHANPAEATTPQASGSAPVTP